MYYGLNYFLTNMNNNIMLSINRDIIRDFYMRICSFSMILMNEFSPGRLMTLLLNDIVQITPFVNLIFIELVKSSLISAVILVYLFSISWASAIIPLVMIMVFLLINRYFNSRMRKMKPAIQKTLEMFNNKLLDHFQGIKILKVYDLDDYEKGRFSELNQTVTSQNRGILKMENLKKNTAEILAVLFICAAAFTGFMLVRENIVTAGIVAAVLFACFILNNELKTMFEIFSRVSLMSVHLERIEKAFKISGESPGYSGKEGLKTILNYPVTSICFATVF